MFGMIVITLILHLSQFLKLHTSKEYTELKLTNQMI
jgi:hypothetical protein